MYATTKMTKIADSAMIRQAMPIVPRSGNTHGSSAASGVIGIVLINNLSFVVPVRVFRMLDVPEWTAAMDDRCRSEVIGRRWRSGGPLQRPRIPGIIARHLSLVIGVDQVVDEDHGGDGLNDRPNTDDQVPNLPSAARLVGIDAARHTQQTRDVHEVERHVKADDHQPEVPLTQALAHHAARRLRVPVVEGGEDHKENCADQYIVEVGYHEIRAGKLPVEGRNREHDAGQSGDEELEQ